MQKPQSVPQGFAPEAPMVGCAEERKQGYLFKATAQNAGVSRLCLCLGFPGAKLLNLLEQSLTATI